MSLILTIALFLLAYKYLDRNSTLRQVILVCTGIVIGMSALSFIFSILSVVVYLCIVALFIAFIVAIIKRFI